MKTINRNKVQVNEQLQSRLPNTREIYKLAWAIDVSDESIKQYIKGRIPRPIIRNAIAKYFGLSVSDLWPELNSTKLPARTNINKF